MKEADRVPKNGYNEYQRYSNAQEAGIIDAIARPCLLVLASVESAGRREPTKPPATPNATAQEQAQIVEVEKKLKLDVQMDIYPRIDSGIKGMPRKERAERILKGLRERTP